MRRPVLIIFFCIIITNIYNYCNNIKFVLCVALTIILLTWAPPFKKVRKAVCLWMVFSIMISLHFYYYTTVKSQIISLKGADVVIHGYIQSAMDKGNRYGSILLTTETIENGHQAFQRNDSILIYVSKTNNALFQLTGKQIRIRTSLEVPDKSRNPKGFDYNLYLKTKGIYVTGALNMEDIVILDGNYKRILQWLAFRKHEFITLVNYHMKEEAAGFLIGLLFGDKSYMDASIYSDFQKNGTAHILAVSGLHIGILYSMLQSLGRKNSILKDILVMILLAAYILLSDFSYSVIRAVSMIFVFILSKKFYRKYDLIASASISGIFFMLLNPYILFNVGFQLSFAAVFAIGIVYPFVKKFFTGKFTFLNSLNPKFLDSCFLLLSVQLGTMPLIAYHFNSFSLSAFFINIPVILGAGIVLPIGFMMMVLGFVHLKMFHWTAWLENILIDSIIAINQFVVDYFKESFQVLSPGKLVIGFYYAFLLILAVEYPGNFLQKQKKNLLLMIALIACMMQFMLPRYMNTYDIAFVDVGQGDCIHIKTPQGKNILIDGGGKKGKDKYEDVGYKILRPYLLKNHVRHLDYVILSHLHEDHYKGIVDIMDSYRMDHLVLSELHENSGQTDFLEALCRKTNTELLYVKEMDKIILEKDIFMTILHSDSGEKNYNKEDENNHSLVILLEYQGNSILLTGDIEKEVENELLIKKKNINCDIIKVPHHGGATSSTPDFVGKTRPKLAIIQVGKNTYGHPSEAVIGCYKDVHAKVLRNDQDGAILLDITEKGILIKTQLSGEKYEL